MFCSKCGNNITTNQGTFCQKCGTQPAVSQNAETTISPTKRKKLPIIITVIAIVLTHQINLAFS